MDHPTRQVNITLPNGDLLFSGKLPFDILTGSHIGVNGILYYVACCSTLAGSKVDDITLGPANPKFL